MSAPRQNPTRLARWHRGRRLDGFTLPEAALALLIVVLGIMLGLTLANRLWQRRNHDRYIADLRTFSAAFRDYNQQHKSWPASSHAGVPLPAPLAAVLRETNWSKGSPFGGNYGWVAPEPAGGGGPERGWGGRGAVTLTAFSPSFPLNLKKSELLQLDRQIDDGNLASGRFRTGFNGWPVYLVETAKR